jgi:uracil-DNA glycosylase
MTLPPPQLEESWKKILQNEWEKRYLKDLADFIARERASAQIFPPKQDVFNAFQHTPFDQTKVVIIGQDPYHGQGQAHGLSFSVLPGIMRPPSLKNIFKELEADLGIPQPTHGFLQSWANQGVLLLNAVLTVRAREPGSHQGKGWEQFTDAVVRKLCERKDPVIFVLWGKTAQEKCRQILQETKIRHYVLTASHPSPYSAYSGFFGCRHFSKINDLLKRQGKEPLNWKI